jgi:hypothetical protein
MHRASLSQGCLLWSRDTRVLSESSRTSLKLTKFWLQSPLKLSPWEHTQRYYRFPHPSKANNLLILLNRA